MQHYTKAFKAVFDILGLLDRSSITIRSEFFSLQILPDQQGCLLLVLKHRSATRISGWPPISYDKWARNVGQKPVPALARDTLQVLQEKAILIILVILGSSYSYGHLLVITGYFYGIIHSINGVISTYSW